MKIQKTVILTLLLFVLLLFTTNCNMLNVFSENQFIEERNKLRHAVNLNLEDFESGNLTANPWVVVGYKDYYNDYSPKIQTSEKYSGNYSLSLSSPSDNNVSNYISINIYCPSGLDMTFYFKMSNNDVTLYITDNKSNIDINGNVNWTSKKISLSRGDHKLIFKHYSSRDYIFIDHISFSQTVSAYKDKVD